MVKVLRKKSYRYMQLSINDDNEVKRPSARHSLKYLIITLVTDVITYVWTIIFVR